MLFKFHYEILIAAKHFYFLFFRRLFSVSFSYADSFQSCFILEIANRCYGFFFEFGSYFFAKFLIFIKRNLIINFYLFVDSLWNFIKMKIFFGKKYSK